jgi:glycosyltransferase involved in cell wall biosynthesis
MDTHEHVLRGRLLWGGLWRRSLGPSIAKQLGMPDVIHVAGLATPPTGTVPLVISVDDLRPFRDDARTQHRSTQLKRAVDRGARIVVSSRTAAHEVQEVLGLERTQFAVIRPPVGSISPTNDGRRLVLSVTGQTERFFFLAPQLVAFAHSVHSDLVVVGSSALGGRLRAANVDVTFLHRRNANQALAQARVFVSMSDGARFPSLAIAALGAGVPTVARATEINRELLGGAAALIYDDDEILPTLQEIWSNDGRRSIARAAGLARAHDFAPAEVASAYAALYAEVAKENR